MDQVRMELTVTDLLASVLQGSPAQIVCKEGVFTLSYAPLAPVVVRTPRPMLVGINASGGEMGATIPGTENKDYLYPNNAYIDWIAAQGFKLIRLPFRWRRVLGGPMITALKASDLKSITRFVDYANSKGLTVLLDLHDYGRFQGNVIGTPTNPTDYLAYTWKLIATAMANKDVWFGLMNEPHDQDMDVAHKAFQLAVAAIRSTGHTGKILVPSGSWSGAHSFIASSADRFLKSPIVDDNWAIEVHQYLDSDSSGTHAEVVVGKGSEVLKPITEWALANKFDLFLGEFGVGRDAASITELDAMVKYMHSNSDVWIGHTYWACGPWWPVSYIRAIGPAAGMTNEQLAVLKSVM